jgi:hypothetical protein
MRSKRPQGFSGWVASSKQSGASEPRQFIELSSSVI